MQCVRIGWITVFRVSAQEPSGGWVVVPCAEVVEAEVLVVLFAAIQVVIRCRACGVEQVAEGIVVVGVGDRAGCVGQLPDAAAAIVPVEARRPRSADDLLLADPL